MKKVLVQDASNVIDLSQVTNDSIVGIKWRTERKGFVVKLKNESFVSIGNSDLNADDSWSETSVKQYIKRAFERQEGEAFVFDTLKELYRWLAED